LAGVCCCLALSGCGDAVADAVADAVGPGRPGVVGASLSEEKTFNCCVGHSICYVTWGSRLWCCAFSPKHVEARTWDVTSCHCCWHCRLFCIRVSLSTHVLLLSLVGCHSEWDVGNFLEVLLQFLGLCRQTLILFPDFGSCDSWSLMIQTLIQRNRCSLCHTQRALELTCPLASWLLVSENSKSDLKWD
jgi:hypothetical protein